MFCPYIVNTCMTYIASNPKPHNVITYIRIVLCLQYRYCVLLSESILQGKMTKLLAPVFQMVRSYLEMSITYVTTSLNLKYWYNREPNIGIDNIFQLSYTLHTHGVKLRSWLHCATVFT